MNDCTKVLGFFHSLKISEVGFTRELSKIGWPETCSFDISHIVMVWRSVKGDSLWHYPKLPFPSSLVLCLFGLLYNLIELSSLDIFDASW